ncbi:MAG: hypothetical protein Q8R48_07580, partial [Candidatus Omnitrophota bacterium]|nr:hypothetical protein [Candidatus Omnitrophota bacterium]
MRIIKAAILALGILGIVNFPADAQDDAGAEYTLSIEEYLNNALPPQEGRSINYSTVTGILAVTDTPSNQRLIQKLVKQFDIGPRQVLIEAKFVEIEFEDLDELGIEWFLKERGDININSSANTNYQHIKWDDSTSDTF